MNGPQRWCIWRCRVRSANKWPKGMFSATCRLCPPWPNVVKKRIYKLTQIPAMAYAFCYALCRASTVLLTTRMAKLWTCESECAALALVWLIRGYFSSLIFAVSSFWRAESNVVSNFSLGSTVFCSSCQYYHLIPCPDSDLLFLLHPVHIRMLPIRWIQLLRTSLSEAI